MPDKYEKFDDLAAIEKEGVDYRVISKVRSSSVAVIAPHGGQIEPGTSHIAAAIAGDLHSLYCFEGLKPGRPHSDLHITSSRFDEPECVALTASSEIVVAIHGRVDGDDSESVWIGGLDRELAGDVAAALKQAGFKVKQTGHRLPGEQPENICNRGKRGAGVQLELPRSLRDRLTTDNELCAKFVSSVQTAASLGTERISNLVGSNMKFEK